MGATVYVDQLPLSESYREVFDQAGGWIVPLSAGDDYELCFTVNDEAHPDFSRDLEALGVPITCIGMIEPGPGLRLQMPDGSIETTEYSGYEHFA